MKFAISPEFAIDAFGTGLKQLFKNFKMETTIPYNWTNDA